MSRFLFLHPPHATHPPHPPAPYFQDRHLSTLHLDQCYAWSLQRPIEFWPKSHPSLSAAPAQPLAQLVLLLQRPGRCWLGHLRGRDWPLRAETPWTSGLKSIALALAWARLKCRPNRSRARVQALGPTMKQWLNDVERCWMMLNVSSCYHLPGSVTSISQCHHVVYPLVHRAIAASTRNVLGAVHLTRSETWAAISSTPYITSMCPGEPNYPQQSSSIILNNRSWPKVSPNEMFIKARRAKTRSLQIGMMPQSRRFFWSAIHRRSQEYWVIHVSFCFAMFRIFSCLFSYS